MLASFSIYFKLEIHALMKSFSGGNIVDYNQVKLRSIESSFLWQLVTFASFYISSKMEIYTLIKSFCGGVFGEYCR